MNFRGEFEWIQSLRLGGRKAISFTLKCTNLLTSESFDAAILDGSGARQPMYFTGQSLSARKSLRFDYDTVGWDWCQGDKFVILNKKGKIREEWVANMKTYAYGECPSCHGTHRCPQCAGSGRITDRRTHMVETCQACAGTGQCQTCYLPMHSPQNIGQYTNPGIGFNQMANNADVSKQKRVAALNSQIQELQAKIEKINWDLRIMKLRDISYNSQLTYQSILRLRFTYEQQLIKLQSELRQLEMM